MSNNSSNKTIKVLDDESKPMNLIKLGANRMSMIKQIAQAEELSFTKVIKIAIENFLLAYYMNGSNLNLHTEYKLVKRDDE